MGYYLAMGECLACRKVFSFNPDAVPSMRLRPEGVKEPICEECFDRLNKIRKTKGLEPWVRMPDAYKPAEEGSF